ncbi:MULTISPECIES: GNAT family protein [unclassified Streptomyces]|uniref:GNAT family N-acetyltransferase n=1 Tax=unclassified Streptomyces TaxID=2593676 RepID=UPI002E11D4E7|nr:MULTISPECIES: GNAT family protein [unclassified Streptomyces]WSR26727.1 GNAT family N-acetyltransferase [Streptomyces sp. NBC_01205]
MNSMPSPLALRPFRPEADAPALRRWITTRAELVTWAGPAFTWPLDDAQLTTYAAEPDRHTWTAASPDGTPLGHVSVRGTRLGRVLIAPEARGRGLGESLLTLAVARAFGELGLSALDLGVYTHNTAAVRLYEKLGFRAGRVLEDVEEVDGVRWSALQMQLTAPDR